jgi:drug/metabolite transporter (DMT)-like permease
MTRKGWLLFGALSIIWGLPYMLIRVSVREVSPAFLVFVRTGGAALLLTPLVVRQGRFVESARRVAQHWKAVVIYTFVEIAVPWWLLFSAEKRVTSSLAGLLVAAVPIAGAVIARLTGSDHLDARRLAGLGLGIAGVAALVGLDVGRSSLLAASSFLVIVAGYALGPWILGRYLSDLPGVTVIASSLVLCALVYLPLAVAQWPAHPLSANVLWSMAGLTVLCTAVAFVALFSLIGEVGAMRATVVTYLNPAVAVVLGVSVLGEHFGVGGGVGFVCVLGGSYLATRPAKSPASLAHDAQLLDAQLGEAQLLDAQLGEAQLLDAQLGEAQLLGAQLGEAHLEVRLGVAVEIEESGAGA